MRLLSAVLFILSVGSWSAAASENVDRLTDAMRMSDAMQIFSDEGVDQARVLDTGLLNGTGGAFFQAQIEDLYDPVWMLSKVSEALSETMTDGQLEQAALFFESDLGQTIVSLENSARRAFSDDAIEEMALTAFRDTDRESERYRLVEEYIQVNDLIERNVKGGLSADYSFFRGLADGQGIAADDSDMLARLLSQTAQSQKETREWLFSFLLVAYGPLTEAQMRRNIAFSRTEAGRALNDALFLGLDGMFDELSYEMGLTAAQVLGASDL